MHQNPAIQRINAVLVQVKPALPGEQIAHLHQPQRVIGIGKTHLRNRHPVGQ